MSRKPIFNITVDGKDITNTVASRLIELEINDARGFEADDMSMTLSDADGLLAIPPRGSIVWVQIGFEDEGLHDHGLYVVDEIEHSGPPDQIMIRGRSADFRDTMSQKREKTWDNKTIAQIVETIAQLSNITAKISPSFKNITIKNRLQTNESDCNFLTRLAEEHDAIATIKSGILLFLERGKGQTASGQALPTLTITRQSGDSHRFALVDRENCAGVTASYYDPKTQKKGSVGVKNTKKHRKTKPTKNTKNAQASQPKVNTSKLAVTGQGTQDAKALKSEDSGGSIKRLRGIYRTKDEAERAAKSAWQAIQRGMAEFSITLAYGRADIFPEIPVTVKGFKDVIDNTGWICTKVAHRLNDGGFTTSVDLEIRSNELAELIDDEQEGENSTS